VTAKSFGSEQKSFRSGKHAAFVDTLCQNVFASHLLFDLRSFMIQFPVFVDK